MQLFLILASCKGHNPLQQLVMLTLSCLCSSNSRPPPSLLELGIQKGNCLLAQCWRPPPTYILF